MPVSIEMILNEIDLKLKSPVLFIIKYKVRIIILKTIILKKDLIWESLNKIFKWK